MKMNDRFMKRDTLRITQKDKYGKEFLEQVETAVSAIAAAGYNPYNQLFGYLTSGTEKDITRSGNAREIVKRLNFSLLWDYTETVVKETK